MGVATISPKSERMIGLLTPILGKMTSNEAFCLPADVSDHSRVLVIDSGDLTEILFFAPVVAYLKDRFPGMRITYLVREGNSELVRTMPQISEMISYEKAHLSLSSTTFLTLAKRIRDRDFDVAFLQQKPNPAGQTFNNLGNSAHKDRLIHIGSFNSDPELGGILHPVV